MFNTIIFKRENARLTKREYEKFQKGDLIFGENRNPEELKRWVPDDEDNAKIGLARHCCSCKRVFDDCEIVEYAPEYCECDEDGEFIQSCNYILAEEINM